MSTSCISLIIVYYTDATCLEEGSSATELKAFIAHSPSKLLSSWPVRPR